MPQVIVNPDEMRRFAVYLDELRESLQHKKFNAAHSFENLRQSWRDAKMISLRRHSRARVRTSTSF